MGLNPICEPCADVGLTTGPRKNAPLIAHHIVESTVDPTLHFVLSNLLTVCPSCHQRIHAALRAMGHVGVTYPSVA